MEEITSPLKAIKAFCKECIPEGDRVKECTASLDSKYPCPLYPFRTGHNPYRKGREYTDEEKVELAERMRQARMSKS